MEFDYVIAGGGDDLGQGLWRAADAFPMPTLVGGNTNALTIMMAEKIADQMRLSR